MRRCILFMNLQSRQGSVRTVHLYSGRHRLEQLKGYGLEWSQASSLTCLAVDVACQLGPHLETVVGTLHVSFPCGCLDFLTSWQLGPKGEGEGTRIQTEAVSPLWPSLGNYAVSLPSHSFHKRQSQSPAPLQGGWGWGTDSISWWNEASFPRKSMWDRKYYCGHFGEIRTILLIGQCLGVLPMSSTVELESEALGYWKRNACLINKEIGFSNKNPELRLYPILTIHCLWLLSPIHLLRCFTCWCSPLYDSPSLLPKARVNRSKPLYSYLLWSDFISTLPSPDADSS